MLRLTKNPLNILTTFVIMMLGLTALRVPVDDDSGIILKRNRLMGIEQMITMPYLLFASNTLYRMRR